MSKHETGRDRARRGETGPRRALKYYFFGKISTDLNSQCKNISKKTLGKNFPHYLCPRLVKTSFKQSDQVFSLSPTMRWGGAETGRRRDRDGHLDITFLERFQLIQIANAKIFLKITWVKIFLNIYTPISLRLVLSKAIKLSLFNQQRDGARRDRDGHLNITFLEKFQLI